MNIFEEFMAKIGVLPWPKIEEDIPHTVDTDDFPFEEGGDCGIIRYYDLDGSLLVIKNVKGADDYDICFTELCFDKLTPLAEKWLKDQFALIKQKDKILGSHSRKKIPGRKRSAPIWHGRM